ncbi:RNA demethylase ALKBH9B-like isoform X2 [Telopea speciosissima]|uniref:RNA demethylase ALKBH9B-like isoform X2 n=1 Tax=Telopea speciosissima TaxID=54955 RepID=UPI001CC60105|nr:RNA demethylase ALKBH9B-like isoform X2 [Telopea speciosissima]
MTKEGVSGEKVETSGDSVSLLKAIQQLCRRKDILEMLSEGFCPRDKGLFQSRFEDLSNGKFDMLPSLNGNYSESLTDFCSVDSSNLFSPRKRPTSDRKNPHSYENTAQSLAKTPVSYVRHQMSYSDSFPALLNSSQHSLDESEASLVDELNEMSRVRMEEFAYIERINGKPVDIVSGLELHTRVFNELDQKKIVDYVYRLQRLGQEGQLRARTYSAPKKWMRGKGRVTIQFGCCYNYAVDKKGNLPGIMRDEEVDPLPPLFKNIIKRLVKWNVLPPTCVPNSCIVNIYDKGDCIPPHIDHHDFLRPFCTLSLLTECKILFGSNLKIDGPGEFSGPIVIPLPVGSVLVLQGNGSDVAKHCVPGVPAKRISITFRKMDDSKLPFKFKPDPELQGLQPLSYSLMKSPIQQVPHRNPIYQNKQAMSNESEDLLETASSSFHLVKQDFPPTWWLKLK